MCIERLSPMLETCHKSEGLISIVEPKLISLIFYAEWYSKMLYYCNKNVPKCVNFHNKWYQSQCLNVV
jgi:hypothetical protein